MTNVPRSLARSLLQPVCAALPWRQRGAWPLAIALLVTVLSAGSGVGAAQPVAHAVLINPWAQQNRLSAADAARGDNAGLSVALSGTTAVVGVPGKKGSTGAAYVFVHSGRHWYQQARLTASDGVAGDQFGFSVALSGDAALVGAPFKNTQTGAAYVFVRHGTDWHQQARLTASGAAGGDWFGSSVALSGSTALVGAPQRNNSSGAAYVFVRRGTAWHLQDQLTAGAAAIEGFGLSVALSGSTALVGAPQRNGSSGAAYVFVPRGTGWHQQARLTAGDAAANDELGTSVALGGNTALVGAPGKNLASGAAYVFVRRGAAWHQQARLTAGDAADEDNVGLSVAVSADTAVAGAPGKNGSSGATYVFVRSGTTWYQQTQLTAGNAAASDELGTSVALSGDTALVGAPGKSSSTGAVYVLVHGGTRWSQQARPTAGDATAGDRFGFSMAVSGASALVGAPGKDSASGVAYMFLPSGTGWHQQARLSANDAAVGARFGFSVAFAGDTALVGAPGTNRDTGAAYVFIPSGGNWRQLVRLSANNAAGGQFGFSVAFAGDTALVGAPGASGGAGAAYVFVHSGTRWSEQARLSAGDSLAGDELGTAVSLSRNTALVGAGAPLNTHAGAAYVFGRSGTRWRQQVKLTASDGAAGDQFGLSAALSGSAAMIGAPFNTRAGAAYVFVRSGTGWRQQVKLTSGNGAAGDRFGLFVALSGATGLVGAPGEDTSAGVAYVYVHSAARSRPTRQSPRALVRILHA